MEFGPYGPSLKGTSGFQVPLGMGRFSTFPYRLDAKKERERYEAMMRRRQRLRELSGEWAIANRPQDTRAPGQSKKKQSANTQ